MADRSASPALGSRRELTWAQGQEGPGAFAATCHQGACKLTAVSPGGCQVVAAGRGPSGVACESALPGGRPGGRCLRATAWLRAEGLGRTGGLGRRVRLCLRWRHRDCPLSLVLPSPCWPPLPAPPLRPPRSAATSRGHLRPAGGDVTSPCHRAPGRPWGEACPTLRCG